MDVWSLTRAALRRWYVLLPGLGLAAVLTVLAGQSVAPEYETTGSALLVPPPFQATRSNPYDTPSAPEALRLIVSSSETRARLAAQGLDPSYEVVVTNRTPIFTVRVRASSMQLALATGAGVFASLMQELERGQGALAIPAQARARLQIIDAPDSVTSITSGATRVQAVVALLGFVLSITAAVVCDDLLLLRRLRQRPAPAHAARDHNASEQSRQAPAPVPVVEPEDADERALGVPPAPPEVAGAPARSAAQASQPVHEALRVVSASGPPEPTGWTASLPFPSELDESFPGRRAFRVSGAPPTRG